MVENPTDLLKADEAFADPPLGSEPTPVLSARPQLDAESAAYNSGLVRGLLAANLLVSDWRAKAYLEARLSEVTELPNKRAMEERLSSLQTSGEIRNYALLFADGRNFKRVNDTYSHPVGDHTLRETVYALMRSLRSIYNSPKSGEAYGRDEVFHISGDEVIALIYTGPEVTEEDIDGIRHRVNAAMQDVLMRNPHLDTLGYGLDIGIALPNEESTIESLKAAAEEEMKLDKEKNHKEKGKYDRASGELEPTADVNAERRRAIIAKYVTQPSEHKPHKLDVNL